MSWATLSASTNRVALNRLGSVSIIAGAVTGQGFLTMPGQVILDGSVINTDYSLSVLSTQFGGLLYGDGITVDGINYQVREARKLDDGAWSELLLSKLAPDSSAPGQNPRTFGLDDLSDVALVSPTAGEVLKYDGVNWVDGTAGAGSAFVFTQSSAATTWTINHNLGYIPSVELFDSGSQEIDADVSHPSVNTTIILLSVPTTGFARLT